MSRIGICDDKEIHITAIKKQVENFYLANKIKFSVSTYNDGYSLIMDAENLDIIFLDIEMPEINGIEVKDRIQEHNCKIIFLTNYPGHMKEAFGRNVIQFLSKNEVKRIGEILTRIENEKKKNRVFVITGDTYDVLNVIYVKAETSYSRIYTKDDNHLYRANLTDVYDKMKSSSLVRVHRSYVVNMKYIKELGTEKLMLTDGTKIPVSRKLSGDIKSKYFNYIKELR